jgi:undecaprenyl-phosphate 4-deoxy-4-formamido-L-arabinose transferase
MEPAEQREPTPAAGAPAAGVSVVVPAFNSAAILPELVRRLTQVLSPLGGRFEVILVNDGSRDETWQTIQKLCRESDAVRGIDLLRNFGQHNALLCGVLVARHAVTVTVDDDLQHPPEEIPKLLACLDEGIDVVYGTPKSEQHGFLRNLASRLTKAALSGTMGAETAGRVSAFRAFRTHLREAFRPYRGPFVSLDVLLTWGTSRFGAVEVEHRTRPVGESNYTFGKLVAHAFNMMTGFSTVPLQVASWIGFSFTLFGIAVLAFVVGRYLVQGTAVPGFAFLASIIAVFSGAQLFALGIIGEYLARMHFRLMDRPVFVIRAVAGGNSAGR